MSSFVLFFLTFNLFQALISILFSNKISMMPSSANVDMSPISLSFWAILRRILLMILPDLVLGRPGACWITSGVANGPIFSRTENNLMHSYIRNTDVKEPVSSYWWWWRWKRTQDQLLYTNLWENGNFAIYNPEFFAYFP